MLNITRRQLIEGLLDARFLFVALLVILAFVANGIVYSSMIINSREDWSRTIAENTEDLSEDAENLQTLSRTDQRMVRPVSSLSFIADDGAVPMPNALQVDAFWIRYLGRHARSNDHVPMLPALDWGFIVGTLMTLLAVIIGFGAICGEKRDGTLVFAPH